jgi:hypothetical protein
MWLLTRIFLWIVSLVAIVECQGGGGGGGGAAFGAGNYYSLKLISVQQIN